MASPVTHRRCTDVRFPSGGGGGGGGHDPAAAWLTETTARRQRGSVSLHCCVAIVSRSLQAAGARNHAAARAAAADERRRRLTDDPWTDRPSTAGWPVATTIPDRRHDDAASRYFAPFLPANPHVDDERQRITAASISSARPAAVRDCRRETQRRARSRSGSDSDSSHRPCVRDMRFRPPTRHWPGTPYILTPGPVACDIDEWRSRRRDRNGRKWRTNDRAVVENKAKKDKLQRQSVSSERSSTLSLSSSSSSRSSSKSKDQRVGSKHSTDEHVDDTEDKNTAEQVSQTTATDGGADENLRDTTDKSHESTCRNSSPGVNGNADHAVNTLIMVDQTDEPNCANADVKQSPIGRGEGTLDNGKTLDVGNELPIDSSTTDVRPSKSNATSDGGLITSLSDITLGSEAPTVDSKEVDNNDEERDSVDTRKRGEGDSECTKVDSETRRHSRDGSRPRSGHERLSVETTKSETSAAECHGHKTESTSEGQKMRHSLKRSRSRSKDGNNRTPSKHHHVDHEHRTKSRHDRHERKRSHRHRSHSSSRGRRHSFSPSSGNDRSSSAKRNRKRRSRSPNTNEDRLKAELEKLRKKAKKAVRKLQELELNFDETHSLRKKSRPEKATKLSTTTSGDGLLDVNSNKCDWKGTEPVSDKFDVDFIAAYTSPVSSPSELSEGECNSLDDPEPLDPQHLEKTSAEETSVEKQCDEREQRASVGAECAVITGDVREQAIAAVMPSSSTLSDSTCVTTATSDQCSDVPVFDSRFDCDSTETATSANDASQTAAEVDDKRTVQLGLDNVEQDKPEPELLACRENVGLING